MHQNKLLYFGIFVYAFLDILTTYIGLSLGAQELNPFIKTVPLMILAKVVVVFLIIGAWKYLVFMKETSKKPSIIKTSDLMRKVIVFIILFVGLAAFGNNVIIIASADGVWQNGTAGVFNYSFNFPYTFVPDGGAGTMDWYDLRIDNTSYSTIDRLNMTFNSGNTVTFAKASSSTPFTVLAGCSNTPLSGFFAYRASSKSVDYNFLGTCTVNNNTIRLSFENTTIVNDIVMTGCCKYSTSTPLSQTRPAGIRLSTGDMFAEITGGSASYYFDGAITSTVNYSINYIGEFFNINITKPTSVVNKVYVNQTDSSGNPNVIYTADSTFNSNPLSYFGQYGNGLYMNMCLQAGACQVLTLNSTNAVNAQANQTIPGYGGSEFGQIYYDYSSPYIGGSYGINASVNSSNQALFNTYYIYAYDPSGLQIDGSPIKFTSNTYNTSRLWKFFTSGKYNTSLKVCNAFDITCSNTFETGLHILDTAYMDIASQQIAYKVTTDRTSYYTGQKINVTAVNPSAATVYLNMFLQVGGQNTITDMPIPANTNKSFNVTVTGDMIYGNWEISMYTGKESIGKVSTALFTIGMPNAGEAVGLRWGDQNFVGRDNILYYVTNANASTVKIYHPVPGKNTTTLLDTFQVYNSTSGQTKYLMDVAGSWNATIVDDGNAENISYANMTVLGNATFACNQRLPDYICFDKESYVPGERFTINYKVTNLPYTKTLGVAYATDTFMVRVVIYDPDDTRLVTKTIVDAGLGSLTAFSVPTAGAFGGRFTKSAVSGTYHVVIVRDGTNASDFMDGTTIAESYATVVVPVVSGADNVPEESRGAREIVDGWVAMFNMGINDATRLLFAVMIIMIFTACGFVLTDKSSTGGIIFGFIPYAFFAFIAYIPIWITIVLVLIIVNKLRWF